MTPNPKMLNRFHPRLYCLQQHQTSHGQLLGLETLMQKNHTNIKLTGHQRVTHQPSVDGQRPLPRLRPQGNVCLHSSHGENETAADSFTSFTQPDTQT